MSRKIETSLGLYVLTKTHGCSIPREQPRIPASIAYVGTDCRPAIHFLSISTVTQVPLLTTSNTGDSLLSAFSLSTLSASVFTLKFTRIS